MTIPRALNEEAREAWQRYSSCGAIPAGRLREATYRAWTRAHEQGASPQVMRVERMSATETERLLEQRSDLLRAARPYLNLLSQAAGEERHAAMLADGQAFVLDVVGDEASVRGPERVPEPGCLLSEAVAGSNGLGSPLAEGAYASFVGPEHFIAGFHAFTCQGIPIKGEEGRLVGALSTSVRRGWVSRRLRDILVCAARSIEAELLRLQLEKDVRSVLQADPRDSAPLVKLHRDVIQAQHSLRLRLQAAALLVAESQLEQAQHLLVLADELRQQFERQARLWHGLASSEVGSPQRLALATPLRELVELLLPEAASQGVELVLGRMEHVLVEEEPRGLSRLLFQSILDALQAAGRRGTARIEVRSNRATSSGEVILLALPAMGVAREPQHKHLTFPAVVQPILRAS